jgi:hypothetical protein
MADAAQHGGVAEGCPSLMSSLKEAFRLFQRRPQRYHGTRWYSMVLPHVDNSNPPRTDWARPAQHLRLRRAQTAACLNDQRSTTIRLLTRPSQTRKSPIPVPPIPDLAGTRGRESPIPDSAGIGNREPPFPDSVGNGNRGPSPDWPQIGKSGILLCVSTAAAILG